MSRILVTGGAGFIGSHTCLNLLESGYEVVLFDSFVNSSNKVVQKIIDIYQVKNISKENNLHVFKGDLRDIHNIENVFRKSLDSGFPIEGVIHFAGLKSIAESLINPILYWDVNVKGTINLINIMNKYSCNNIVFSSSATIYGKTNTNLIDESAPISPLNPYGITKYVVEKFLNDIYTNSSDKWSVANLRYFNPVGAHHSGFMGENPIGEKNNIFPIILDVASKKIEKFEIYGDKWPTHDGTGVRDYIHVMDIAESHLKTLEYLFNNKSQLINLNLGTGKGTSVLELIHIFQETNNVSIPYSIASERPGDVPIVVANNKLAFDVLNWKPKRNLEDICRDGWKFRLNFPNGY